MTFSSQHHSFDIRLAAQFGVECAILIHHFQHWIRLNRFSERNIREGRCWTYQTRKDIQGHFPYWSYDEVRRLCEKLVSLGVLITGNFNKSKIDKTLWYAFVDESAFGVDQESSNKFYERQNCQSSGKTAYPSGKTATPIPDSLTDTKTEDKREREASPSLPPTFSTYKRLKFDNSKLDKLYQEYGEAKIKEMMDRLDEYADLNPKRFKQYACHAAVIGKWLREEKISKTPSVKDAELLEKLSKHPQLGCSSKLIIGSDYVEFVGMYDGRFKAGEVGFQEKVLSALRKIGVPVTT